MTDLAERLCDRQSRPTLPPTEHAALREQLRDVVRRAQDAWPGVSLSNEAFVEHLADRLDPEAPVGPGLEALAVEDLYLACACARDEPGAIARFEQAFTPELRRAFTGGKARGMDADDLRQRLRERLFVEQDGRPARIASYTGEGSLRAWVRVAATRLRIDTERRRWDLQTDLKQSKAAAIADAAQGDPELAYLKAKYRKAFATAFEAATQTLTPKERNLLRLNVVHGVSGTALATMYGVHRATAKRWLAAARETLLARTRSELQRALALDSAELDSVMGLVGSRLEVSLARVLGPADEAAIASAPAPRDEP